MNRASDYWAQKAQLQDASERKSIDLHIAYLYAGF
jgi:hypothetical protein